MVPFLKKILIFFLLIFIFTFFIWSYFQQKFLTEIYEKQQSTVFTDRKGEIVFILPNERGYINQQIQKIPPRVKELLIKKEDKYFYYHFGFNPFSICQEIISKFGFGNRKGSSTITQQLAKILLNKEKEKSTKNKILELFSAISLEIFKSKDEILKMYINSVYFGNQVQGIKEASRLYFGVSPELLNDGQILQLLATISSPSEINPLKPENITVAQNLAQRLKLDLSNLFFIEADQVKENVKNYFKQQDLLFEIKPFLPSLKSNQLTIDKKLTQKLREIVKRNIEELKFKHAKNAALIVIKIPENEILALIGSPDPTSFENGYQVNMLKKPRPIGSTIKPFIYLKAFEKGLRPYTLVEDREYKYITALGFPLYPKNFDWKYRGEVSLHYALSNSLNVPAVKVLEYVGLENFYQFLEKDLEFKPIQDLNNYQLGIALGALEMNLMDLAKYFTIFPNQGILKSLKISFNQEQKEKIITKPEYVQLVNKILSDRKTAIDQFGLKSDLNLFQENYALKTGTSRNFKDSWIVGYTPDFLVGVWVGNVENEPMEEISGQLGAGKIWSEAMELLFNSNYNKRTPFDFSCVKEFYYKNNIEFGLKNDDFEKSLTALKDNSLILNPHDGDKFLLKETTHIILRAKNRVNWFVNDEFIGSGKEQFFSPKKEGCYKIKAKSIFRQEIVTICVIG